MPAFMDLLPAGGGSMPGLDQYRVCMTSSEAEAMKSEQLSVQVVLKQ